MIKGWVYVITDKAKPGLVKVGYSMKDPTLRAKELDGPASPHPHIVDYEVLVEEPRSIEQKVHSRLKNYREGKEWFRCTPEQAVAAIKGIVGDKKILENFKRADRKKTEELLCKEEELRLQKEAQEKQRALIIEKEQQIINKHDKIIKDATNTGGAISAAFLCAFFISLIGLAIIDTVLFKISTSDVVFIIVLAVATFVIGNIIKPFFIDKGFFFDKKNLSTAYNNRGIEFCNNGFYVRAIKDYNKAIKLNPSNAQLYKNRGAVYKLIGNTNAATNDFDKAISLENTVMIY